jgi:hypothetical protein
LDLLMELGPNVAHVVLEVGDVKTKVEYSPSVSIGDTVTQYYISARNKYSECNLNIQF